MRFHCLSSFVFLFGFSLIFAQTSLVGKVFSVDGDPVNGVEVHNLSRKTMVKTSQDGSFAIDISLNDDIRFVRKGYERLDVLVNSSHLNSELILKLKPYYTPIEEVKIGYKVTGNISKDSKRFGDSEELNEAKIELGQYIMKESAPSVMAKRPDQFVQPVGPGFSMGGGGVSKWDDTLLVQGLISALTKDYFLNQMELKETQIEAFIRYVFIGFNRRDMLKYGFISTSDLMRFVTKADKDLAGFKNFKLK